MGETPSERPKAVALLTAGDDPRRLLKSSDNLAFLRRVDPAALTAEERSHLLANGRALMDAASSVKDPEARLGWVDALGRVIPQIDPETREEITSACKEVARQAAAELEKETRAKETSPLDTLDHRIRVLGYLHRHATLPAIRFALEDEMAKVEEDLPMDLDVIRRHADAKVASLRDQRDIPVSKPVTKALESLQEFASDDISVEEGRYVLRVGGKRWRLEAYDDAGEDSLMIAVVDAENPVKVATLPYRELAERLQKGEAASVVRLAEDAYRSEQEGSKTLEKYDLPQREPITYLRVFPKTSDFTVRASLFPAAMLSRVLRTRYPNLSAPPIVFTDQPEQDLDRGIGDAYKRGCRFFWLDLYAHGSEAAISYRDPLGADGLLRLAKKYPDAKFQFSTIACHGGGLRQGIMDAVARDRELRNRITVFLQTKPHTANKAGHLASPGPGLTADDSRTVGTYYSLILLRELATGRSIGAAVRTADEETKRRTYGDPEAIIGGHLISRSFRDDLGGSVAA